LLKVGGMRVNSNVNTRRRMTRIARMYTDGNKFDFKLEEGSYCYVLFCNLCKSVRIRDVS